MATPRWVGPMSARTDDDDVVTVYVLDEAGTTREIVCMLFAYVGQWIDGRGLPLTVRIETL